MSILAAVFVTVLAYLLGSVPFGLIIAKTCCGIDPREAGSRNVGATNVGRVCGFSYGMATLACDVLKGFIPVVIYVNSSADWASGLYWFIGLAVIVGHIYSVFLNFKGGKGVATTVGVFLACAPFSLIIAGIACLAIMWRTGYISAGSLTLIGVLPVLFLLTGNWPLLLLSLISGGLVAYAHRENIKRLLRGEERSWL